MQFSTGVLGRHGIVMKLYGVDGRFFIQSFDSGSRVTWVIPKTRKDVGKRLGSVDLAAIAIGAYEPRWFMQHDAYQSGRSGESDARSRCQTRISGSLGHLRATYR